MPKYPVPPTLMITCLLQSCWTKTPRFWLSSSTNRTKVLVCVIKICGICDWWEKSPRRNRLKKKAFPRTKWASNHKNQPKNKPPPQETKKHNLQRKKISSIILKASIKMDNYLKTSPNNKYSKVSKVLIPSLALLTTSTTKAFTLSLSPTNSPNSAAFIRI